MQQERNRFRISSKRAIILLAAAVVLTVVVAAWLSTHGWLRQAAVRMPLAERRMPSFNPSTGKVAMIELPPTDQAVSKAAPDESGSSPWPSWGAEEALAASAMLIKTADARLEVRKVEPAVRKLGSIASQHGGFITNSQLGTEEEVKTASVTFRVPSRNYTTALHKAMDLGRVLSVNESSSDVGQEYVDIQSRLRNLRNVEQQLLQIMQKARQIKDVLAVQREINPVRQEIEVLTGRERYLRNQVTLSTITVSLTEPTPSVTKLTRWDLGRTAKGAVNALLSIARGLASVLIWLIIVFVPLSIAVTALFWVVRRVAVKQNR